MSNFDFSILDFNKNDLEKSRLKNTENKRNIDSYVVQFRNDVYEVGNFNNLGLNSSLSKDLLNTTKIKKIAKGWQLTLVDWFAIQDFIRAYKCSKTQVATYALRYYIPKHIYDDATLHIVDLYLKENTYNLINVPLNKPKAFENLEEFNVINNRTPAIVSSKYENTIKGFSWDFYKIDSVAAQLFSNWSDANYNSIIKNAIRSFLQPINYSNAEEILDLLTKQDNERDY